jgi:FlaA1/EpsC-like NDP-sugar epimerase
VQVVPRSVFILYPILGAALVWGTRRSAGWLLKTSGIEFPVHVREKAKSVLIYGADATGVQLLEALRRTSTYIPVGFVDLSPTLWGQTSPISRFIAPSAWQGSSSGTMSAKCCWPCQGPPAGRQAALKQLEGLMVGVRTLPAMEDLAEGRVTVSDLRPVERKTCSGAIRCPRTWRCWPATSRTDPSW